MLKKALEPHTIKLNETERARNTRGDDNLFVGNDNALYESFENLYANRDARLTHDNGLDLDTNLSDGVAGRVWCDESLKIDAQFVKSPISYLCPDLMNNLVLYVKYKDPQFGDDLVLRARVLDDTRMPKAALKPCDWDSSDRGKYGPSLGFNGNDGYRSVHGGVASVNDSYKTKLNSDNQSYNQYQKTQYQRNFGYDYGNHSGSLNQQRDNRNYQRSSNYKNTSGSGGGSTYG